MTEAYRGEQPVQGGYATLSQWELKSQPIDRKSNNLLLSHCVIYSESKQLMENNRNRIFTNNNT